MELLRSTTRQPATTFPFGRSRYARPELVRERRDAATPPTFQYKQAQDVMRAVKSAVTLMRSLLMSPANMATQPGQVLIHDQRVLPELSGGLISYVEHGSLQPSSDVQTPRVKVRSEGLTYRMAPAERRDDARCRIYRIDGPRGHVAEVVEFPDGTCSYSQTGS